MINKTLKLLLVPLLVIILFFTFSSTIIAACEYAAICDAPAGTWATTCNGGQSCIIAGGVVTRPCDEIIRYEACSREALEVKPYCTPTPIYDPTCDGTDTSCTEIYLPKCYTPGIPPGDCGDGLCNGTESCANCETDCGFCEPEWCGDNICNNGEDCSTCALDCGTCNTCGDGICTGGEDCSTCSDDCGTCDTGGTCGNGSCDGLEWCGTCSEDCGSCITCGDGSCNGNESCTTCSTDCGSCTSNCGNGICGTGETCNNCATDCGSCTGAYCGDFECTGFEDCNTCENDCGACNQNEAWFQVSAGHIGSENGGESSVTIQSNITDDASCVEPGCVRALLIEDSASTNLTDGFTLIGSGIIDANGLNNERGANITAANTRKSRYQEKYEFFYRNSDLGISPSNDFTGQETDAQKPTYNANKLAYFQSGDLTISSPWSIATGETYVVFVQGNLTLADGDGSSDQLINVDDGGFIAFIVSGNIDFDETLGNSTLTDTTANVEGVYIANGTITTQTRGAVAGGDDRFVGEGIFVGWNGVDLDRDFADGAGRSEENNDKAVETFIYRPDLLVNMPDMLRVPIRIWQETN